MNKPFIVANVRDLLAQMNKGEISFSRMIEIMNEMSCTPFLAECIKCLKEVTNLESLLQYPELIKPEHEGEAQAINAMFKNIHRVLEKDLSLPQSLKPLSDKEIETIFHENCRSGSVDISKSEIEPVLTFEDYKDCLKEISKLFSLPVDNTVSETETIDFWKIQNNSLQELITEKDLEIASLKEVVSEKSTFFHNQYKGILNEWEKCVSDRDMNIELLVKDVERLTSQLSLYNKADNILKDIVMCKSNEIGEDLTKRVVKILEDLKTLKQE